MDQIIGLNRWYDSLPETRRMLVIPLILIVVGGINMALTIGSGFPFALLFVIALLGIIAIRAPYAWGFVRDPKGHATAASDGGLPDLMPHRQLEADWLYDANLKYNALPEPLRMMAFPLFLAVVGWINMSLTLSSRFPFGLLFLFGVLAVVGLRLPFEAGWLKKPGQARGAATTPVTAPAPLIASASAPPTLAPSPVPYEPTGPMLSQPPQPESVVQTAPSPAPLQDPAPPA